MKIAIIGTRGIPNNYGGFEQFAEKVSVLLLKMGYEITVYNSSLHPYLHDEWNGVKIVRKNDPENKIGTAGQFLYDLNCILHTRSRKYDIILQLGYTSSSVWNFLFRKRDIIITNMDGIEWKRSKYSAKIQSFLKYAEKLAVKKSDYLIADSKGIQSYLKNKYNVDSSYIAYGADIINAPNETLLNAYNLQTGDYNLLIARFEPENNIEAIIKGHIPYPHKKLILVGNPKNEFGTYLTSTYKQENIIFLGAIYDEKIINALRYYCGLYFHGHSVGGTNPSLIEAMACGCLIVANQNEFNEGVLGDNAFYFKQETDIHKLLDQSLKKEDYINYIQRNYDVIKNEFNWLHIAGQLDELFKTAKAAHG